MYLIFQHLNNILSHLFSISLQALILDNIHFIDVVQQLLKDNILSVEEWMWQKQLRFYQAEKGKAIMRMVDAEFQYTFEYQGKQINLFLQKKLCFVVDQH